MCFHKNHLRLPNLHWLCLLTPSAGPYYSIFRTHQIILFSISFAVPMHCSVSFSHIVSVDAHEMEATYPSVMNNILYDVDVFADHFEIWTDFFIMGLLHYCVCLRMTLAYDHPQVYARCIRISGGAFPHVSACVRRHTHLSASFPHPSAEFPKKWKTSVCPHVQCVRPLANAIVEEPLRMLADACGQL